MQTTQRANVRVHLTTIGPKDPLQKLRCCRNFFVTSTGVFRFAVWRPWSYANSGPQIGVGINAGPRVTRFKSRPRLFIRRPIPAFGIQGQSERAENHGPWISNVRSEPIVGVNRGVRRGPLWFPGLSQGYVADALCFVRKPGWSPTSFSLGSTLGPHLAILHIPYDAQGVGYERIFDLLPMQQFPGRETNSASDRSGSSRYI